MFFYDFVTSTLTCFINVVLNDLSVEINDKSSFKVICVISTERRMNDEKSHELKRTILL